MTKKKIQKGPSPRMNSFSFVMRVKENLLSCGKIYCYAGDAGEKNLCGRKYSNAGDLTHMINVPYLTEL